MHETTLQAKRRGDRYRAREVLWAESRLDRVRACGRRRVSAESGVALVLNEGVAHFANVQTCGSVHACPVCGPKIRQERAGEIERGLGRHFDQGGGAEFVTLTLRHYRGDDLAALITLVADGFRAVVSGRRWQADREAFGVVGTIRSLEITHGENGWHPHLHVLVLTSVPLDDRLRGLLRARLYDRWCSAVNRAGVAAPSLSHGIDVRPVTREGAPVLGAYLAKGDVAEETIALRAGGRRIGMELTRHDLKAGRSSRSPWALLASVLEVGDAADLALWHEYETATRGRQSLTWSAGLKGRLLVEEVTDEELAAIVQGGDVLVVLDAATWAWVTSIRGLSAGLLAAAEWGGMPAVARLLSVPIAA